MDDPSVLMASVYHESSTFVDSPTDRGEFKKKREYFGSNIHDVFHGTDTEVGGVIDIAEDEHVELIHTVMAEAVPGGPVTKEAFGFYTDYIVDAIEEHRDRLSGVILPLHGGMVVEGMDDGEGPLVSSVRDAVGPECPIAVAHDLHANVTDEMVSIADVLIAREVNPHTDMAATGRRTMLRLVEIIRGEIDPSMHIERPPVVPCGPTMMTQESPMADLMSLARDLEAEEDNLLKVNVCPGFSGADVPSMGFAVVGVSDGQPEIARRAARRVSEAVWKRREGFVEEYSGPAEGIEKAVELAATDDDGPVVVAEMNDNPGGGAPADGTPVLRELLDQDVKNAGFAIMQDPEAVEACIEAGVGARVTITVGGKTVDETLHGAPIEDLEGYVKAVTDGRYFNHGPQRTGTESNLGQAVRFQCGADDSIAVVLTDNRVQPYDAEIWRHVGVQPERQDIIVVKSAVHYQADYGPMASHIVQINGPGLASMDPRTFEFKRVRRPKYPLDKMDTDSYPNWK